MSHLCFYRDSSYSSFPTSAPLDFEFGHVTALATSRPQGMSSCHFCCLPVPQPSPWWDHAPTILQVKNTWSSPRPTELQPQVLSSPADRRESLFYTPREQETCYAVLLWQGLTDTVRITLYRASRLSDQHMPDAFSSSPFRWLQIWMCLVSFWLKVWSSIITRLSPTRLIWRIIKTTITTTSAFQ